MDKNNLQSLMARKKKSEQPGILKLQLTMFLLLFKIARNGLGALLPL
jgi:hypothetical protein